MVAPGEQRGAGRRTQRRGMEIGVAQTTLGEAIDVRRIDGRTVAAEMREAGIVEQDDDDVRRSIAWLRQIRPPRLRLGDRGPDPALELVCHRVPPRPFVPTELLW